MNSTAHFTQGLAFCLCRNMGRFDDIEDAKYRMPEDGGATLPPAKSNEGIDND
jgi:hypothetical protein